MALDKAFKVRKGLVVDGSGSTLVQVNTPTQTLFSVNDTPGESTIILSGSIKAGSSIDDNHRFTGSIFSKGQISTEVFSFPKTFTSTVTTPENSFVLLPEGYNISGTLSLGSNSDVILIPTGSSIATLSDLVHDDLVGFVTNEHIDHSAVSVTAGSGLNGGGDLTATRTLSVDSGSMLPYYSSSIFSRISGDITVNSSTGVATIAANSVALGTDTTGNYVGTITAGTGIDTTGATTGEGIAHSISVDVSDFMTNGADNRVVTATGTDAMNAEANLTFDGSNLTTIGTSNVVGKLLVTGSTSISGSTEIIGSGSNVFQVYGSSGLLFAVDDDLTDSLFSVNTIAGLPVIEAFANNTVTIGTFGSPAINVISGSSAIITGSFTGSLTGELIGTGSWAQNAVTASYYQTFPHQGTAIFSGSVVGQVDELVVSSNTASMDLSQGNFFTLTLPSSSTTHLTSTNIQPGQTINLLITQQSTSGSLEYSSEFKFGGGIPYLVSATGSVVDLLSFVTFDTSSIYGSWIKNLS